MPEVVHFTVATPYPGTETWLTEPRQLTTRDYRLFDVQHAVLPTKLPLHRFYEELVRTQAVLNRKHLGWAAVRRHGRRCASRPLARGQTNYVRMLWKFSIGLQRRAAVRRPRAAGQLRDAPAAARSAGAKPSKAGRSTCTRRRSRSDGGTR